jgi:AsmA protein
MTDATPKKSSLARKLALAAGALAVLLVALVAGALLLLDSQAVATRVASAILPAASKALGREVTLSGARLRLVPETFVRLEGLTVAGREGEPPLVASEALQVELRLWPLLRSIGKDVEVTSIVLQRPTVNLVRGADGVWNYEGLGGAAGEPPPAGTPPPAPAPAPAPPPDAGPPPQVAIRAVEVKGAAIRVVDRAGGQESVGVALEKLDVALQNVGVGLPFAARIATALASAEQNLFLDLQVARLPGAIPARPEDWPRVQGAFKLAALPLERFRALLPPSASFVRGGTASLEAQVSTRADGAYQVEGAGQLASLKLRGQPASGRFRATATWAPLRPDAATLRFSDLGVQGPGVDLSGHALVETRPLRASFVVTGPLLDLDAVMGVLPPSEATAPAEPAPEKDAPLLPAPFRRQVQAASARGTVAIAQVRSGRMVLEDVKARAVLRGGTLVLEELEARTFGGSVSAAGTKVNLAEPVPTWTLAAKLAGVRVDQAMGAFAGKSPLVGQVNGTLELAGEGTDWEKLRQGLTGLAALALTEGTLTTTDLGDQVLGGLGKALQATGRAELAGKVAGLEGGKTTIRDLGGQFTVKDGALRTTKPFSFRTPYGTVSLGGALGLDAGLDLQGSADVERAALAKLVNLPRLPETLEVPLGMGGSLFSPTVSVRADEAVKGLVQGEAKRAVEGAKAEATKRVDEARKEAEEQAKEKAQEKVKGILDRLR